MYNKKIIFIMKKNTKNIVILISGYGSNLYNILNGIKKNNLDIKVSMVISDNKYAYGINFAKKFHINYQYINLKNDKTQSQLLDVLLSINPSLIVLAGFMTIIKSKILSHFHNKIINIHPSLLPKYPGLNTHIRVLQYKEKYHGVTVHIVDNKIDHGKILKQEKFMISNHDDINSIKKKIKRIEKNLYLNVIKDIYFEKIYLI